MGNYSLGTISGKIEVDGSAAAQGFKVAEAAANGFFGVIQSKVDSVKRLGTALTVAGTVGSAGLALAVKTAASFQQELSKLQAVSGATGDEMSKVRQKALQLGADTVYSADESAQAMTELAKAGVPLEGIMNGAADAAIALASAGEISLTQAAEISANAMNQFGMSAQELPHVADLIAGAANASAIEVGDFGTSIAQAGAVASMTGVSFDDLAVAIAQMGQAGIRGSDAGTSIKTFLTNLIPTTDRQIAKFNELGLTSFDTTKAMQMLADKGIKPLGDTQAALEPQLRSLAASMSGTKEGSIEADSAYQGLTKSANLMHNQFFDANGEIKSMAEVEQVLSDATKNMSSEQKLATLELLFGADAIRAASVLSKDGAKGFNDLAAAMANVGAEEVAKTKMDNFLGSMEQLKGSLETARIIVGSVFLPMLQKMADAATWLVNVFNKLPTPIQTAIALIVGLGSAMSLTLGIAIHLAFPLAKLLAHFLGFKAIGIAISMLKEFAVTLVATRSVTKAYDASIVLLNGTMLKTVRTMKIVQAAQKGMAAAWAVVSGPIGWAILAIVAVGVAVYAMYKKWQPFHDMVNRVAAAISDRFMPTIRDFINTIKGGFSTVWNSVVGTWQNRVLPALRSLWESMQGSVIPALKEFYRVMGPIAIGAFKLGAAIVSGILLAFMKLSAFLTSTLTVGFLKLVAFLLGTFVGNIARVINFITGTVIPAFRKVGDFVGGWLVGQWRKFTSKLDTDAFRGLASAARNLWAALKKVGSALSGSVGKAFTELKASITVLWGAIKPLASEFGHLISSIIPLKPALLAIAAFLGGPLIGSLKIFEFYVGTVLPAAINGLTSILTAVIDSLGTVVNYVNDKIVPAIQILLALFPGGAAAAEALGSSSEGLAGSLGETGDMADRTGRQVKGSGDSADEAKGKYANLTTQLDATTKAEDALRSSAQALAALNAGQSITDWASSMADLQTKLNESNGALNNNTAAGRELSTQYRSMASSARQYADEAINAAKGAPDEANQVAIANQQYRERVQLLLDSIPASQKNSAVARELKASIAGIPDGKNVTITESGATFTLAQVSKLAAQMNVTPEQLYIAIHEAGANPTIQKINEIALKMGMTPKQLQIAFRALGIDKTVSDTNKVADGADKSADRMGAAGERGGKAFGIGVKKGASGAAAAGAKVGGNAAQGARAGSSTMPGVGAAASGNFVQGIGRAAGNARSAGSRVGSSAKSGAQSGGSGMSAVGSFMMQGLSSGIGSMAGALFSQAASIASTIKHTIESALRIGSPSKWAHGVGKFLTIGLRNGIRDGGGLVKSEVDSLLKDLMDKKRKKLPEKYKKTGNKDRDKRNRARAAKNKKTNEAWDKYYEKAASRWLKSGARAAFNAQQKALDNLNDKLKEAISNLDSAKKEYADYKKATSDSVKDTGNIVNAWNSQTSSGMVPTFQSIADAMQEAVNNAATFDAALKKINSAGLNPDIIRQLVDAGVGSSGQVAALIAAMSPEEIAKLNALQSQLDTVANSVAVFAADKFYAAGVAAAQGIVNGLNSQIRAITATLERLIAGVSNTISIAIGAKKPPKKKPPKKKKPKKKAIGGNYNKYQDYLVGDDGMEVITTAKANGRVISNGALLRDIMRAGQMIKPVVRNLDTLTGSGRIGSKAQPSVVDNTKNVNVEVNNYNPVAEPSSVTIKNTMTRLAVIGVAS